MTRYTGIIDRYRAFLPLQPETEAVSLGEGNTPLIECINLPRQLGIDLRLFVKFEGLNPTGSFKDRGMTMAVTKAKEEGSEMIICASTGNTSAAAAAYAARAGMRAFVVIPEGKIALGGCVSGVFFPGFLSRSGKGRAGGNGQQGQQGQQRHRGQPAEGYAFSH